jgi:hypothetical protein
MITREKALELLNYDAEKGKIYWRVTFGRMKKGAEAGCVRPNGYRMVGISGYKIMAHRLIWLLEKGTFPSLEIDHINRQPDDNRIINLREVTRQQNVLNRGCSRNNRLSLKGVHRHQDGYRARIMRGSVTLDLGMFDTAKEAAIAYTTAEKVYETFCQVGN